MSTRSKPPGMVVMGASAGGLNAVRVVLSALSPNFPLPVAVAQHRDPDADTVLRELLQRSCSLPVLEPDDKEPVRPGSVYLAPPDYHLLVEGDCFALSTEAPVDFARPSINALFESAADVFGKSTIGIILSGNLRDGADGLARIKEKGGFTIVQEPAQASSSSMPSAAIATAEARAGANPAARIDKVLKLEAIGPYLENRVSKTIVRASGGQGVS